MNKWKKKNQPTKQTKKSPPGYWTALGIFPWWSQGVFQFKKAQYKINIPGIWRKAELSLAHALCTSLFQVLISYNIVIIWQESDL